MLMEPKINDQVLQAICNVLGETNQGLTGREISKLLIDCNIGDPFPKITKRDRLFEAFKTKQNRDGCANNILSAIRKAMSPVNYINAKDLYEDQRNELSKVL